MSAATVIPLPTPLGGMSLRDLESELLGLAGHIAAAECRFLQLLAEFDDRDGWAGDGIRSCAHWLSWRAGMSLRTATERLHPQVQALDMITTVDDPALGPMRVQNVVWRMGRTPGRIRSTGRRLGEDTDEVLADAGLSESEVAALRERGVVG